MSTRQIFKGAPILFQTELAGLASAFVQTAQNRCADCGAGLVIADALNGAERVRIPDIRLAPVRVRCLAGAVRLHPLRQLFSRARAQHTDQLIGWFIVWD